MKGLEISRRFFVEWGLPWLQKEWPDLVGKLAAGRVAGSDIIGADDEWSQDHAWGPRFDLWLTGDDHRRFAHRLRKKINAAAPREFMGAKCDFFGKKADKIDVGSINACFKYATGVCTPPRRVRDWFRRHRGESLVEKESWLYFIKHGHIFHDPLGEFSSRRKAFASYPRDVRLKVMQSQCITLWYVADYKFRWRLIHRTAPYPFHFAVSQVVDAAMRLCFYLNDDYAPHWQWLHHEFEKLPESRGMGPILDRFLAGSNAKECAAVVQDIIDFLTTQLADRGWIESGHNDIHRASDEIKAQITDKAIRDMY